MRKYRVLPTLVLIAYSAVLIKVIVFKDTFRVPAWLRSSREDVWVERPPNAPERALAPRSESASTGAAVAPLPAGAGRGSSLSEEERRRLRAEARRQRSAFDPRHANFVPFKTIWPQLRGRPRWTSAIINLTANTVLFMPIGFLVTWLYRRTGWRTMLTLAIAVGLTMEVLEGVFKVGVVDIDDVILNALGVMAGYWVFRRWERRQLATPVPASASVPAQTPSASSS